MKTLKKIFLNYELSSTVLFLVLITRNHIFKNEYFSIEIETGFIAFAIYCLVPIVAHLKGNISRRVFRHDFFEYLVSIMAIAWIVDVIFNCILQCR